MSQPEQILPADQAAVWSAVRPYLVARIGPEAVDKLDALITNPSAMAAEPQTRMRLLRELAGGGTTAPLTSEQMSALLAALPVLLSSMSVPKPPPTAAAEAELVGLLAAAKPRSIRPCSVMSLRRCSRSPTRPDRTFSPFYAKELIVRGAHLAELAEGPRERPSHAPLQADPVLPP